jgi:hypothetical protein
MSLPQVKADLEAKAQAALQRGDVSAYQRFEKWRHDLPGELRQVDQEFAQEERQRQQRDQMDAFQRQLDEQRQEIDLLRAEQP